MQHVAEPLEIRLKDAGRYLATLDLPPAPRRRRGGSVPPVAVTPTTGDQGIVVGSEIVSFVAGVPPADFDVPAPSTRPVGWGSVVAGRA